MGVLKSSKKKKDESSDHREKGKEELDSQGIRKPVEEKIGKRERTKDRVRRLHIYTHEERHGRKEPLRAHPHHLKKKEKEEGEEEDKSEEETKSDISEEERSEAESEEGTEEQAEKQKERNQHEEEEIADMDKEAALAKFKTTEAGLPEVLFPVSYLISLLLFFLRLYGFFYASALLSLRLLLFLV